MSSFFVVTCLAFIICYIGDILTPVNAAYGISSMTRTLVNPSFPKHQIPTFIYYPSTSNPSGDGFPTIVFAHGFECSWDYYTWVYQHFVPMGFVVAYINSYALGSMNGTQFAIDQRYTLQWLQSIANDNTSSPLYQQIDVTRALASGHSECGGASLTSTGNAYVSSLFNGKYSFNSIFVMAPCGQGTAADDAKNIDSTPVFAFTGTMDCICPQAEAIRLYNSIPNEDCKYLGNVANATHCQWMNAPFAREQVCIDAESDLCEALHPGHNVTITNKEQLDIARQYMELFITATITDESKNVNDFNVITQQLNNDKKSGEMFQVDMSTTSCGSN